MLLLQQGDCCKRPGGEGRREGGRREEEREREGMREGGKEGGNEGRQQIGRKEERERGSKGDGE